MMTAEGVLGLAGNRRTPRPLHKLLAFEPVEHALDLPTSYSPDRLHGGLQDEV